MGLAIAVAGGTVIEKLHMEKYVESFILSAGSVDIESDVYKRQGHESIDITYRYAHLFPTRQTEMADRLDMERKRCV